MLQVPHHSGCTCKHDRLIQIAGVNGVGSFTQSSPRQGHTRYQQPSAQDEQGLAHGKRRNGDTGFARSAYQHSQQQNFKQFQVLDKD